MIPEAEARQLWENQIREISQRYIQELRQNSTDNMDAARGAYFELIKILLSLSAAALPILATVLGLSEKYVQPHIVPFLIVDISLFLASIVLGICAKGFAALHFRKTAHEGGEELIKFLTITDVDKIYEYFQEKRAQALKTGIFKKLNLMWFFGQLATFLVALMILFWICYESIVK